MTVRPCCLSFVVALAAYLASPATAAAGGTAARALGMAGAFSPIATGVEAPRWNPANLATGTNPGMSMEFLAAGFDLANNGISLDLYNRTTGSVLSTQDKVELLSAIPDAGLSATLDATASALGFQMGSTALTFRGVASAHGTLPHDFFELVLMGNGTVDRASFDEADGEAVSYASAGASAAMTLLRTPVLALHGGITVNYLQALGYARVTNAEGFLSTGDVGVVGEGEVTIETAGRGQGFGFDLGVAAELGEGWRGSLSLQKAYANLHFDSDLERTTYHVATDTLSVDTVLDADDDEEFVESTEVTTAGEPFSTTLAPVMVLGLGRVLGHTNFAFQWTQGFRNGAGSETSPRLSAGAERYVLPWLPLRAGLAWGGVRGPTASLGTGVALGGFRFDLAGATHGGVGAGAARGLTLALGLGWVY